MLKRTRYDSLNECCLYMKRLKLTNSLESTSEIIIEEYNKEFGENIENKITNLHNEINKFDDQFIIINNKINKIEKSVEVRLNNLDNKITDVNSKLDKLINIISNMSDNQLYNRPVYIS